LFGAAGAIMSEYGQPKAASMRDSFGSVTINQASVNYITLDYHGTGTGTTVTFSVSGAELWQHLVQIDFEHRRWFENKSRRCVREKEAAASNR